MSVRLRLELIIWFQEEDGKVQKGERRVVRDGVSQSAERRKPEPP